MIPIHFHILKDEASLSYEKGTILELFLNQLKNKLSYIMFQKLNSECTQSTQSSFVILLSFTMNVNETETKSIPLS